MENPEAIFDVLSIRSMKEKYYASPNAKTSVPNVTKTCVFTPTPSAAIATDLAFLANQEALEHFVQDFAIDDSISDCFADTETTAGLTFPSQAPYRVEPELLTRPPLYKPDTGVKKPPDVGSHQSDKLPPPTKPKVTFALQTSQPAHHANQRATITQLKQQSTEQNIESCGTGLAQESDNFGLFYNGTLARLGNNQTDNGTLARLRNNQTFNSSSKSEVSPPSGIIQGQGTPRQGQKVEGQGKATQKEKEKDHSSSSTASRFPKFGLSWVKGHALYKGRKHQTPNANNMLPSDDSIKTTKIAPGQSSEHDRSRTERFEVFADVERSPMDYTISSIGITRSRDEGVDDVLVTPRHNHELNLKNNKGKLQSASVSVHRPAHQFESSNLTTTTISGESLNSRGSPASDTAQQELNISSTGPFNSEDLKGEKGSSASYQGKSVDTSLNTGLSSCGGNVVDGRISKPWYDSPFLGDAKTDTKTSFKYTTKLENSAVLCDVINTLAESEKDSEFSFGSKSNASKRRSVGSDCSSLRSASTADAKTRNNVTSVDSTSPHHGSKVGNPGSVRSENIRNNSVNLKSVTEERAGCEIQNGRDGEKRDKAGLLGDEDGSTFENSVLSLICAELVRTCIALELKRKRCLSSLKSSVPEACASLIEASSQLRKLVTSSEVSAALDKEIFRQVQQKTEDILSTTTSLRTAVTSVEMALNDGDHDNHLNHDNNLYHDNHLNHDNNLYHDNHDNHDNHLNHDNHFNHNNNLNHDNHNSLDEYRVLGVLKATAKEMLKNGKKQFEIKNNLQRIISEVVRPGTNPPKINKDNDYEDVKLAPNSPCSNLTTQSTTVCKNGALRTSNKLNPEDSYPSTKGRYLDIQQASTTAYKVNGNMDTSIETAGNMPGIMKYVELEDQTREICSSSQPAGSEKFSLQESQQMTRTRKSAQSSLKLPALKDDYLEDSAVGAGGLSHSVSDLKGESSPERAHDGDTSSCRDLIRSSILHHHTTVKGDKPPRTDRRKRIRSHSSSRLQYVSGSSDIFNDSSSDAEETSDALGTKTGSASQNSARGVRGRRHRRRSHSAMRHRSRSRRNSSCHSCQSDGNSKFRSSERSFYSGANLGLGSYWSDDEISERKFDLNAGSPARNMSHTCAKTRSSNFKRKDFGLSRSELARYRKEKRQSRSDRHDRLAHFDVVDHDNDDDDDEDVDDEDDDDDDGESLKVCVNVPNEECSNDVLRIQRLKQHLHSMQKLRQKSRDVIETVVTGTGERLAPRPVARDGKAHVNIGEAYPFKSQADFNSTQPQDCSLVGQPKEKIQIGKSQLAKGEKPWGFFKGKRGVTSHLFNHKRLETSQGKVRELTESEFEETFERRNDVTVRRRREMDAGIPWDELEFSGLESDATLTGWSDGER